MVRESSGFGKLVESLFIHRVRDLGVVCLFWTIHDRIASHCISDLCEGGESVPVTELLDWPKVLVLESILGSFHDVVVHADLRSGIDQMVPEFCFVETLEISKVELEAIIFEFVSKVSYQMGEYFHIIAVPYVEDCKLFDVVEVVEVPGESYHVANLHEFIQLGFHLVVLSGDQLR